MNTRLQLTLFVDEQHSKAIEEIRQKFNPVQFELIKSHVTLCRDPELEQIEKVMQNLTTLNHRYVSIGFGAATRFSEGKGVLLPAVAGNEQFDSLRKIILGTVIGKPQKHEPHITLMHPRNSICTDGLFEQIAKIKLPTKLLFKKISLIEQKNGASWQIVQEFNLHEPSLK